MGSRYVLFDVCCCLSKESHLKLVWSKRCPIDALQRCSRATDWSWRSNFNVGKGTACSAHFLPWPGVCVCPPDFIKVVSAVLVLIVNCKFTIFIVKKKIPTKKNSQLRNLLHHAIFCIVSCCCFTSSQVSSMFVLTSDCKWRLLIVGTSLIICNQGWLTVCVVNYGGELL